MPRIRARDRARNPARVLVVTTAIALALGCSTPTPKPDPNTDAPDMEPTYTFVSISTAKPGKLQELAELARRPGELMDQKIDGVIARQVGVDEARNSVIVWVTFDRKESMTDYLASEEGREDHGENEDMGSIIESFEMYDLVPVSSRLR